MSEWLRELLHSRIAGTSPHRGWETIHGSELTYENYCPREAALGYAMQAQRRPDFIPTSLKVTFDYGNDLQWRVNNDWLGGDMVGNWFCPGCKTLVELKKRPRSHHGNCPNGCQWRYREYRALDPHTGASCGLDGMLIVGEPPRLRIIECKSEVRDEFRDLLAPRAEHTARGRLYLEAALRDPKLAPYVDPTGVTMLYVCKGYGFKDDDLHKHLKAKGISDYAFSPFKTFEIARDPAGAAHHLSMAQAVLWARQGRGWPCGVCTAKTDKRAKQCCVRDACFSGQVPHDITWIEDGQPKHQERAVADGGIQALE